MGDKHYLFVLRRCFSSRSLSNFCRMVSPSMRSLFVLALLFPVGCDVMFSRSGALELWQVGLARVLETAVGAQKIRAL